MTEERWNDVEMYVKMKWLVAMKIDLFKHTYKRSILYCMDVETTLYRTNSDSSASAGALRRDSFFVLL